MLLARYLDVALSGIAKKRSPFDAILEPVRIDMVECLNIAKAYSLDDATTALCNSLVPDLKSETNLISGIQLHHEVAWIEFDRGILLEAGHFKGLDYVGPKDDHPEGRTIGYLFDASDPEKLLIACVKNRGRVLIEPMLWIEVPKDDQGRMLFYQRVYRPCDWVDQLLGDRTENDIFEESNVIEGTLHIPLVFFALLGLKDSGMTTTNVAQGFKAKKIKGLGVKAGLSKIANLPQMVTMRLSQLGLLHNEAVQEDAISSSISISRSSPRKHLVRGHLVTRDGKIVWRRPHVRGSGEAINPSVLVINDLGPRSSSVHLPRKDYDHE